LKQWWAKAHPTVDYFKILNIYDDILFMKPGFSLRYINSDDYSLVTETRYIMKNDEIIFWQWNKFTGKIAKVFRWIYPVANE